MIGEQAATQRPGLAHAILTADARVEDRAAIGLDLVVFVRELVAQLQRQLAIAELAGQPGRGTQRQQHGGRQPRSLVKLVLQDGLGYHLGGGHVHQHGL